MPSAGTFCTVTPNSFKYADGNSRFMRFHDGSAAHVQLLGVGFVKFLDAVLRAPSLRATRFDLQRNAVSYTSQCSYAVCDDCLAVALSLSIVAVQISRQVGGKKQIEGQMGTSICES